GVDVIQFDEPAFNVFMDEVPVWGIRALERAAQGLKCATAVHICYGYGIKANTDWKQTLGSEWRQYEEIFPAIAKSSIQQVAIECRNSKVPLDLLALLDRARQATQANDAARPSDADITRCRQVVRDWTLRDSRMLVDEDGKPLR